MAEGLKIAIKDESSARAWLDKVMLTNDDFNTAMREAGEVLTDAENFGEGTMVDEFVNLGTNVMNASQKVFNTINEISSTVNTVLSLASGLTGTVTGAINAVKSIFG